MSSVVSKSRATVTVPAVFSVCACKRTLCSLGSFVAIRAHSCLVFDLLRPATTYYDQKKENLCLNPPLPPFHVKSCPSVAPCLSGLCPSLSESCPNRSPTKSDPVKPGC